MTDTHIEGERPYVSGSTAHHKRSKARHRQAAFEEAATLFETYASDIDGAIRKGWYQAGEKKIQVARREQLQSCAKELREVAEKERLEALRP